MHLFLVNQSPFRKKKLPKESSWLLSHTFESTRIKSVLIEIRGESHKLFSDYFKETKGEECKPLDWFVYRIDTNHFNSIYFFFIQSSLVKHPFIFFPSLFFF